MRGADLRTMPRLNITLYFYFVYRYYKSWPKNSTKKLLKKRRVIKETTNGLFFFQRKKEENGGGEEREKRPKRNLTGARVELAIYRFHIDAYETIALI